MSIASGCLPAPPGRTQRLKQAAVVLVALVLRYAAAGLLLAPWLAERRLGAVLQPTLEAAGKVQLRGLQAAMLRPFVRDRLRLSEMQGSAEVVRAQLQVAPTDPAGWAQRKRSLQ